MATRDNAWPEGTPCWVDLGVADMDKARAFYGGLFGWDMEPGPPEVGGYTMCLKNGHAAAGVGPKQDPDMPSVWVTYLAADDVDAVAGRVTENGGRIMMEPMDVMDVGRMAIGSDPAGAIFGLWQARAHIGAAIANEPGAFTWNENMSRDWEAAKAFYGSVFGWGFNDMSAEGFSYATFTVDGRDVGGVGALPDEVPEEVPANWGTYFAVDDADAAVQKVRDLGGQVLQEPFDTPFGRMARVTDDQGAVFSIAGPTGSAAAQ